LFIGYEQLDVILIDKGKSGKMNSNKMIQSIKNFIQDWMVTFWELLKVSIPVIILVKIAAECGLISVLSIILDPIMGLVGLPGSLGIVWATGLLINLYGAMIVFVSLASGLDLTVAQVTILCSMMLIAHSMPLELAISRKAGAGLWSVAILRITGALIYGFFLNTFCGFLGLWQEQAVILLKISGGQPHLIEWVKNQITVIILIGLLIFIILVVMRLLDVLGILRLLERILEPLLKLLGMSGKAAPITVVGMVLGITYGGSLIIKESLSGKLAKKDIFFSMALMGLSHALIEDTLLMMAVGGKLAGILWGRLLFSLIVIFLLVRFLEWYQFKKRTDLT